MSADSLVFYSFIIIVIFLGVTRMCMSLESKIDTIKTKEWHFTLHETIRVRIIVLKFYTKLADENFIQKKNEIASYKLYK